jgi:hypothetical protein
MRTVQPPSVAGPVGLASLLRCPYPEPSRSTIVAPRERRWQRKEPLLAPAIDLVLGRDSHAVPLVVPRWLEPEPAMMRGDLTR